MKYIQFVLFLFFATYVANAQSAGSVSASDAISTGMGKPGAIAVRGTYAVGKNPALIGWGRGDIELSTVLPLLNFNVRTGLNVMTLEDYNYFFGWNDQYDAKGEKVKRDLTEADKSRFRDLVTAEDNGIVTNDLLIEYFNLIVRSDKKIGTFGFALTDFVSVRLNLPTQLLLFALDGNTPNKVFDFSENEADALHLRKWTLSYARDIDFVQIPYIKKLTAGLSLNYVQSFGYAHLERSNIKLVTDNKGVITGTSDILGYVALSPDFGVKYDFEDENLTKESNYGPFMGAAGTGFGVDFGFAAQVNEYLAAGLSFTDLGGLTFDQQVAEYSSNSDIRADDLFDKAQRDSLAEDVKGQGKFISSIDVSLPSAMRLGASVDVEKLAGAGFPGKMLVALEYHQGFNTTPGNSTKPRFVLGMNWDPGKWIPYVRTGFSFGGRDKFSWALGIGVNAGPIEFNFASQDIHSVLGGLNSAKRVSVSFGSRWIF